MTSLAASVPRTASARRVLAKVLLTGFFVLAAWLCGSAVASAASMDEQPAPDNPVGGLVNGTTTLLDNVAGKLPVVGDVVHNVTKAVNRQQLPPLPQSGGGFIPKLPPLLPSAGGNTTGGWVNVTAPTATVTTERPATQPARLQHKTPQTTHHQAAKPVTTPKAAKPATSTPAKLSTTFKPEQNSQHTVSAPLNRDKTPTAPDPVPDPAAPTASVGHPGPSGDRSTSMVAITNSDAGSISRASHGERSDTQYPLGADDGLPSVSPD